MLHRRWVIGIFAGCWLAALMCSALPVTGARADNNRLHIVASFNILADVAHNVAGDAADVETLIPTGADPHTFEPSARDVATLSDADVVLVVGMNFEQGLTEVLDEAAGDQVVAVSACVPVREVSSVILDEHTGDAHDPEGESGRVLYDLSKPDEVCPAHRQFIEAAFGMAAPEQGGVLGLVYEGVCQDTPCDPHVWTDPANVARWALMIRDTLIRLDPARADTYAQNTEAYLAELVSLDGEIAALIETVPPEHRVIMTNHASLNYFAVRYGLRLVGVVIPGGSTAAEPSVGDVLDLISAVQDNHVPAIFTETTVSEDLARQVADETGAAIVRLYTGSLSESDGPAATYIDYMRFNAGQIVGALK
jgi:ABC-type Zn uptake system ZnuABC Zn-binding protein ZnuA